MSTTVIKLTAAVAVGVLTAGCGHSSTNQSAPGTVTSVVTVTPTNTDVNDNGIPDSDDPATDWPGKMVPVYEPATTPAAIAGKQFMQQTTMLEQFAADITDTLKLPYDIPIKGSQCGEAQLYWSSSDKDVVLCYEDIPRLLDQARELGDADPAPATFNDMLLGFYHESGHMMIDLYDLPTVGREEDDADQVSAYLMLRPNDDGTVDPHALDAIGQGARSFGADAGDVDDGAMSDVHSPTKVRMYNLECWTYGADPAYGAGLVAQGLLPQYRADGCEGEYNQLRAAWDRLLEPYLK